MNRRRRPRQPMTLDDWSSSSNKGQEHAVPRICLFILVELS
jgi:hypothetical protein